MKKIIAIFFVIVGMMFSCTKDEASMYKHRILPVKEIKAPKEFEFGRVATITITYELPNTCSYFRSLYYEYKGTTRVIAVNVVEDLETACTQKVIKNEFKFPVRAVQRNDYLFKFWKGKDKEGKDVFKEVVIPVK
ncbi:hypothetical protein [Tenacibaculum maritimum]|uniref:hypothetical protein n=1 Tax=Tenacibaculum maritimum TaxID=107401 RepID=UPI001330F01E|nr:hypothetical protein [Tenacibaculum maritimum]MCD9562109.1 hypothetical protein [Tenacibaculum maritimum]MCD9565628.1 hypothetical protein [Tenacibaculum maritimum]MCD9578497.1 hypothetical protein [Tenacibaculum maritimum]MCD9596446.1 hypothetical protein [Tenacibaculum maritimum]MCD9612514.1 hypothetical protein [Tenacibaculum maritimum]